MQMYAAALARLRSRRAPVADVADAEQHPPRLYDGPTDGTAPPNATLIPMIDHLVVRLNREHKQAYLAPARADKPRATRVIHPSQAGGCLRALGFSVLDLPQKEGQVDAQLARVFEVGHLTHRRLQGYLWTLCQTTGEISRFWEDVELNFPPLLIRGELDCIVEIKGKHRYVVEIKSINRSGFDALKKPKKEWVWQAYLYMASMGLKGAIILVECKDSQRLKDYYVPWVPSEANGIFLALLGVLNAIRNRRLPVINTAHCHFCGYTPYCAARKGKKPVDWTAIDDIDWTEVAHATKQAHNSTKEAGTRLRVSRSEAHRGIAPQVRPAADSASDHGSPASVPRRPGIAPGRRAVASPRPVHGLGKLPQGRHH